MKDEHDAWMIERFPALYTRTPKGQWNVNRFGTLLTPVWHRATANESRMLDEQERMKR